ncbi:DUF2125 domain-containing protein [Pseudophaeobacter sp.]|uniref:DUF2125 domain-containing protein n=1 Tax=Pseudophaeobacter sp. TaxID=1971739 RepID=UPI00329745AE
MRLLKWLCLGAALWMTYWSVAAWGLRTGLEQWFEEQRRQGWQAEYAELTTAGFPGQHVTRLQHPVLADPGTGAAWSADWAEFASPALWPGAQTLRFSDSPQRLSYFDQTLTLMARNMQAEMQLSPGLALELEHLALSGTDWQVATADDPVLEATSLTLVMQQQSRADRYTLTARAEGFTPGPTYRRLLAASDQLPQSFETLGLLAEVTFDTAWDRRAIELRRPQPRQISLTLAEAQWGDLSLKATGDLTVDEAGSLSGILALQAQNWRSVLDMAERSSLLPPSLRSGLEQVLAVFAGRAGQPEKLDITLTFDTGQMWVGPLPLGPAPRLILR